MSLKGEKASPETRRKMVESQLRRWSLRRNIYTQNLLEVHLGRKRSAETRLKMSQAHAEWVYADADGAVYGPALATAEVLGVSRATLSRLTQEANGRPFKVGGRTLVRVRAGEVK